MLTVQCTECMYSNDTIADHYNSDTNNIFIYCNFDTTYKLLRLLLLVLNHYIYFLKDNINLSSLLCV